MSISALILTFNEEENLPSCLESLKWCDDIVVFDSLSTDRTVDIAKSAGARVVQRSFDDEKNQREASLKIHFKYPWVYNPDADEITPPELHDEIIEVVSDPNRKEVAYRVRFKTMFMGRWIRHSSPIQHGWYDCSDLRESHFREILIFNTLLMARKETSITISSTTALTKV